MLPTSITCPMITFQAAIALDALLSVSYWLFTKYTVVGHSGCSLA